jgi:hypothetical protein
VLGVSAVNRFNVLFTAETLRSQRKLRGFQIRHHDGPSESIVVNIERLEDNSTSKRGTIMPESQFDKDFGYLIPFIDKVAAAARDLPNPEGRAELTRLIADEKQRWTRIRQLLSGATSEPSPAPRSSTSTTTITSTDKAIAEAPAKESPGFTVGSLRSPRR